MALSQDELRVIREIHEATIRLEEHARSQGDSIADLKHAVYGNGRPGLKADVQDLQTALRIVRFVVGASVVSLIGVAAKLAVGA